MADYRRVEPRGIAGTGMETDPERIRDLEEDAARTERAWRNAPERGFADILQEAPPQGELADDEPEDPRKRRKTPPPAEAAEAKTASAAPAPVDGVAPAEKTSEKTSEKTPKKALPRVPPDPREALLRKKLAAAQQKPARAADAVTPPTGSHARKPAP